MTKSNLEDYANVYNKSYADYNISINKIPGVPVKDFAEVTLTTPHTGEQRNANFATRDYAREQLQITEYFAQPDLVLVGEIGEGCARNIVDDLISRLNVEDYFGEKTVEATEVDYTQFEVYEIKLMGVNEDFDPANISVDVLLKTKDGKELFATFDTIDFIDGKAEDNAKTGENAAGKYWATPGMIVVKEATKSKIRTTIDDLIKKKQLHLYFKREEA
ncbi:MAG: hypothetical protein ABH849_03410 [Nanoarchaeota archaeon]